MGWWGLAFLSYLILQIFGVGIGLHRYVAHSSFETVEFGHRALLLLATLTGMGSPISWAAIHRYHHRTADTDKDPHSFRHLGLFTVLSGNFNKNAVPPVALYRDLLKDKYLLWIHKNYFKILGLWALALLLISPMAFLFVFCVPIVLVYWVTLVGIVLNHTGGYRNFEVGDRSVNSWILSLITLGDGWHNNHHYRPEHYSHRVKWWEFDMCALIIQLIRRQKKHV